MPNYNNLRNYVKEEIAQRGQEGCDVTGFQEKFDAAATSEQLMAVYNELQLLRTRSDFQYVEPSHLEGIRAARPAETKRWKLSADAALLDRIHGAWLGRIAGCAVGKPVEGWAKDEIRAYLENMGEYPLCDYIPAPKGELPEGIKSPYAPALRGTFSHGLVDDDTNYTVTALLIMNNHGLDFTTQEVGQTWLSGLPYNWTCTAEHQAYANLVRELPLDQVPMYLNPYREWIGAQIRADFWGYAAPGWPEKAAEFAYRDARLTHVKNGIYGEMFCAAAISAALATDDLDEIIAAALNEIPANSRLAETVQDCLRLRRECSTWEDAFGKMLETYYGQYSWVHTNNNLAIVLIALLYGWPDFEKVTSIAVMQGMDTDCNGATSGSILGAALGAKKLPEKFIQPLGGKLETTVIGFPMPNIEELAKQTMGHVEKLFKL